MSHDPKAEGPPPPLVPPDADLRGMPFMPLHTQRLMDSDLWGQATPAAFKAAVGLWCKAWSQVPAGSIPDPDAGNNLRTILGWLYLTADEWQQVKGEALRGFIRCSDGRLYHRVVCESVLGALPHRREYQAKRSSEAERKERERNDRRALLSALSRQGVTVEATIKTSELRTLARDNGVTLDPQSGAVLLANGKGHAKVTRDSHADVTLKREGEGQGKGEGLPSTPTPNGVGVAPPAPHDDFRLVSPGQPAGGQYRPPVCPHDRVLALWGELMPELPQPSTWTGQRSDHLRARWREAAVQHRWPDAERGLRYMRRLFGYCRDSKFLMGKATPQQGRPPFELTLPWLVRPNNWAEVIEGKFHREP